MTNRFKMNRIGFVNFWLYDEEEFAFVDGKLLLRGQNASGKSITTQSFIPFILDGDRTPSRLDPFGSGDRRMEYYFLGEEGRDDSTGYLFLEFKKEGEENYRTIAIGQRAKRGKPMDFWGFVLLDGRRIGYDLQLYKEIGSSKIPYDKREMKAELGEDGGNFFTTSQSEYKKAVNQYIFGFRKEEQYEQYIKLLVKVRAPKLSKEFKPTKVYEILNDSLQTLTDEDLRAMVDAMEKMDEIQERLDLLKRAFEDVKIIRKEYTRYNQYMLAKKAQAYLGAKDKIETETKRLEEQEQKRREAEELIADKSRRLADLSEQKSLKEIERTGLMDENLEGIDQRREQTERDRREAAQKVADWESKIRAGKERLQRGEALVRELSTELEQIRQALAEAACELGELQEIVQWDRHGAALQILEKGEQDRCAEISDSLADLKKYLDECQKEIRRFEELSGQHEELACRLEKLLAEKARDQNNLALAQEEIVRCEDRWITDIFAAQAGASCWRPDDRLLPQLEEKIRMYRSAADAEPLQALLRADYERQRQEIIRQISRQEHQRDIGRETLAREENSLARLKSAEELEPERDENAKRTRDALRQAGIDAVPFYKTVEFSEGLDETGCAALEAQLQKAGILDALVVSQEDFARIREQCPEFLDTILYVTEQGSSDFSALTAGETLNPAQKEMVQRILSNIHEDDTAGGGIYLGKAGDFRHGILAGKAGKDGCAEFVGVLARKRRREQKIRELESRIGELSAALAELETGIRAGQAHLETLQEEYRALPGFSELNEALDRERDCDYKLQRISDECGRIEAQEQQLADQKNRQYRIVLQKCKPLPYGRTLKAYEEAGEALEEYIRIWQKIMQSMACLRMKQIQLDTEREKNEQWEQQLDDAFVEKRSWNAKEKESELKLREIEEFLRRPDIAKRAERLKQLRDELDDIAKESEALNKAVAALEERLRTYRESEPSLREALHRLIVTEACLRRYFEEELALKLVPEAQADSLAACAGKAVSMLRDNDKNREPTDLLQSLHQVYRHHNGSLVNYGTALEDCFESPTQEAPAPGAAYEGAVEQGAASEVPAGAIRKRVRVVSSWYGKRVYLEEFYGIIKQTIDETELLIQQKDRELFEDILSQTISRQLTDRIAESRKWVSEMSRLMREMDTSMGLVFSLDWKPCRAENDRELDTAELEQILLRDHMLLTMEDIEKVATHFRSRIRTEKLKLEENGDTINYMDLVRDALDYRKWFEFHMYFRRGEGERKPLTNAAFNRFSGGEKAMAMYVPLFAAVNAQYKKAEWEDHPRIIALDEAFAGVDDKNISSMFALVHKLDFDYIMNSQSLWGCYETVKGLRIAELSRPQDSQIVSVILYTWNGHEKVLDVQ